MVTVDPSAEPELTSITLYSVQLTFDTPDLEKAKKQLMKARDAGFANAVLIATTRSAVAGSSDR